MYKEYRDTTLLGAVKQCYQEMAGTHRARDRSIQIIRTAVVEDKDLKRHQNVMYTHENLKFALPHRKYRAESKKFRSTFLAKKPCTFRGQREMTGMNGIFVLFVKMEQKIARLNTV